MIFSWDTKEQKYIPSCATRTITATVYSKQRLKDDMLPRRLDTSHGRTSLAFFTFFKNSNLWSTLNNPEYRFDWLPNILLHFARVADGSQRQNNAADNVQKKRKSYLTDILPWWQKSWEKSWEWKHPDGGNIRRRRHDRLEKRVCLMVLGRGYTHDPRLVPTTHDPRPLDKLLKISFRLVGLHTSSFCQRALTNCMENPGRIQMERLIPVEIFRKKSNTFRGIASHAGVFRGARISSLPKKYERP